MTNQDGYSGGGGDPYRRGQGDPSTGGGGGRGERPGLDGAPPFANTSFSRSLYESGGNVPGEGGAASGGGGGGGAGGIDRGGSNQWYAAGAGASGRTGLSMEDSSMMSDGLYAQIRAQTDGAAPGGTAGSPVRMMYDRSGSNVEAVLEEHRASGTTSTGGGGLGATEDAGDRRGSIGYGGYESSDPVGVGGGGDSGIGGGGAGGGGPVTDDSDLNAALTASMRSAAAASSGVMGAAVAMGGGGGGDSSVAAPPSFSDAATSGNFDEEQMREQYRIMATHEAAARVKANTGYDPNAKPSGGGGEDGSSGGGSASGGGGAPGPPSVQAPRPPGPKPREGRPLPGPRPKEPPLPQPRINRSILGPIPPAERVPELCPGSLVGPERGGDRLVQLLQSRGGKSGDREDEGLLVADDEHIVRCLHCKSGLRVKKMASLVRCEVCETVSPATSFRY